MTTTRDPLTDLVGWLVTQPADVQTEFVATLSHDEVEALQQALPAADTPGDTSYDDPVTFAVAADPDGYRRRPHLDILGTAIAETVADAEAGGPGRLIVNMPPRVGKSTTSSLWTPAWYLSRNPGSKLILTTHTHNYAVSWGRKVRDLIRRQAAAGRIATRIAADVSAAGEWETVQGGGMLSTGIGGAITGRGADGLIIDDPIKSYEQAHSAAVREAQWQWWLGDASTRLEPYAWVVLLMTRWHADDLAGRLTSPEHAPDDHDDWRVVRIPAVGEDRVPDGTPPDALDRDVDVPLLHPQADQTPAEALARWRRQRRSRGPYLWNAMYQQLPSEPEGTILRRGWWQFYRRQGDRLVRPGMDSVDLARLRIVQSWDLTFKDTESADWVVGQVWGALGSGPRFLLDQVRERMDFVAAKRALRSMRAAWPSTTATYVEDAANGPAVIAELRDEISGLVPHSPKDSKVARAWAIQGDLEGGSLWLPSPEQAPWVRDLIDECAQFPTGAHDDQVDATTQAVLRLRRGGSSIEMPTGRSRSGGAPDSRLAQTRRTITRR